jgi:flavin-dependent dehydrogenase
MHSRITGVAYHPISLGGPIQRTFHSGLLVVGDAASHVKPTTGGGVIMGLTCAEIAGRTAAHAVRCGDSSARCLSDYERRWKKKVGWDLMVMRRLRLLLNGLTDAQLDRLIALSSRLGLDNCLESYGDVDFQGTSLIRMVRSPRFSATALYLLITSFL